MSSLFTGTPQTATSYVTSSTDTPKWMQDAIFNQIQWSQNIANKPYQNYTKPLVADLDPLQTRAYDNIKNHQGAWQGTMDRVSAGAERATNRTTADLLNAGQNQYLNPNLASTALQTGQNYLAQAGRQNIPGSAAKNLNAASSMSPLTAAQDYFSQAANQNIPGAAAGNLSSATAAIRDASQGSSLNVANQYLQNAGQSSVANIQSYMNPYQDSVLDTIAKRGARNLGENLLPSVSDSFIRAGQFGSGRMGEFGSRAVRDTQEAILDQQAQAAQQGYGQALQASQADLGRQAELGSLAGNLTNADYNRLLQSGAQFADVGQTQGQLTAQQAQLMASLGQDAGQLTSQQIQNLTNLGQTQGQLTAQQAQLLEGLGQTQTGIGQQQQQLGLQGAQAVQGAQAQDITRQMSALEQMAQFAQQRQGLRTADNAALEAAGAARQGVSQRKIDSEYQQYLNQLNYPKQQMDWLSTQIRGLAPITPQIQSQISSSTGQTYAPSPLQQLAAGLSTFKGLQSI